ncbi:bifunctional protein PyrR [Andreesenia angusta]|uniref:Bifunctional protein PyrR n=1 Tax=Andreesenia angusta TaxID=39480 RepID=A0A1S1V897_9FIRM|nr:bifunctional pyr operon transcriptional regulator/uracil phosphoribosyltransferase PyrR [Andreesenia angusta]OHW62630.1 bifunctional protein PyrR [Andreesenia angusta]
METKAVIMDESAIKRAITRISHEIIERNRGVDDLVLVGIRTRGIPFAERLGKKISEIEDKNLDVKYIDITPYRDDLEPDSVDVEVKESLDFDITDKTVILIDDVLYTGRTVRAALDAIVHSGRPKKVQLAVMIDRGHREFPIRPDFVGKNVPTSQDEAVNVMFEEVDSEDMVVIEKNFK